MSPSSQTGQLVDQNSDHTQMDADTEEEIDELDLEDIPEDLPRNKPEGRTLKRIPGESLLPTTRLENIIQAEGVTGNLALSKEGLFVLSVAAEEFIKRLTTLGSRLTTTECRNTVTYRDMASCVSHYQEFQFLKEIIPVPISLAEALELRTTRERELQQDDPAMASASAHAASLGPVSSAGHALKSKGRVNGRDSINGNLSSVSSSHNVSEDEQHDDTDTQPRRTWTNQPHLSRSASVTSVPARSSPLANGNNVITSHSAVGTSGQLIREYPASPNGGSPPRSYGQEEAWQYTGPASGFLQGPGAPFGRGSPNTGRTIYSHPGRSE